MCIRDRHDQWHRTIIARRVDRELCATHEIGGQRDRRLPARRIHVARLQRGRQRGRIAGRIGEAAIGVGGGRRERAGGDRRHAAARACRPLGIDLRGEGGQGGRGSPLPGILIGNAGIHQHRADHILRMAILEQQRLVPAHRMADEDIGAAQPRALQGGFEVCGGVVDRLWHPCLLYTSRCV